MAEQTEGNVAQSAVTTADEIANSSDAGAATEHVTEINGEHTPSEVPSPFQWDVWSHTRRALGQDSQQEFEGARKKLKEATAMLAIEIAHRPEHDWKQEAAELMLSVPQSNHTQMPATAATFGAHASDDKAKKARSAFLDRHALAVEWLVNAVKSAPADYLADRAGIDALVKLTDHNGGLSKIAGEQRSENKKKKKSTSTKRARRIELDDTAARRIQIGRAREQLEQKAPSTSAVIRLGLVFDDGSTQTVGVTLPADDVRLDQALLEVNVVEPLVDQLGELMQAGRMVPEEITDIPKDVLDDPEDPESGFRVGFRHFILADRKPIVISPILTSSSVIVRATPKASIFAATLGVPHHLRTQQRRIMEENIADPERRKVFSARIDPAGKAEGACRFTVTTQAAVDKTENGRNVGVLVEPLQSTPGNLPLDVDLTRFTSRIEGHVTLSAWRGRHAEYVTKATKVSGSGAKKPQKHSFSATTWKIASEKKNDERDIVGDGIATDVEVMTGDFFRVSEVIAGLPVAGRITVEAERHTGLRIAFSTKNYAYEVYVPALTTGGDRTTALVAPFNVPERK